MVRIALVVRLLLQDVVAEDCDHRKTDIGAFDLRFERWKALAEIYPKTINSLGVRG